MDVNKNYWYLPNSVCVVTYAYVYVYQPTIVMGAGPLYLVTYIYNDIDIDAICGNIIDPGIWYGMSRMGVVISYR